MAKATALCMFLLFLAMGHPALGQSGRTSDAPYPLAEGSGVVESVDYGRETMVVSGYRYGVAADVEVEIAGSYGAFTMLQPGMRIYFEYLLVSPSERWMVTIREVPDGVSVEET